MTAAQVASYTYPHELPELAQNPLVQLRTDLDEYSWAMGDCGVCEQSTGGEVEPGGWCRISWRFRLDVEPFWTDLCSCVHAERELDDLLHHLTQVPAEIVLHVPAVPTPPRRLRSLPVADDDSDEVFQGLWALKEYLRTLPVTDVEEFRAKALAAVSSLGLARIEQLGRTA